MPKTCTKCNATFPTPAKLQRHLNRVVPCDAEQSGKEYECTVCGSTFKHQSTLSRHKSQSCKGSTVDRTLSNDTDQKNKKIDQKDDRKHLQPINAFAAEKEIIISPDMVTAVFNANARLRGLSGGTSVGRSTKTTRLYVGMLFEQLIVLAHTNPAQRNIYINKALKSQVYIWDGERWTLLERISAINRIMNCIARTLDSIIRDNPYTKKLDIELADSLGWIYLHYIENYADFDPVIVKSLGAHLMNMHPDNCPAVSEIFAIPEMFVAKGALENFKRMGRTMQIKPQHIEPQGLTPCVRDPNDKTPDLRTVVTERLVMFKAAKDVTLDRSAWYAQAVREELKMVALDYDTVSRITNCLMDIEDPRAAALYVLFKTGFQERLIYEKEVIEADKLHKTKPVMPMFLKLSTVASEYVDKISDPNTVTVAECETMAKQMATAVGNPYSKEFLWAIGSHIWQRYPLYKKSRLHEIMKEDGTLVRNLMEAKANNDEEERDAAILDEYGKFQRGLGVKVPDVTRMDNKSQTPPAAQTPSKAAVLMSATTSATASTPAKILTKSASITPSESKVIKTALVEQILKPNRPPSINDVARYVDAIRNDPKFSKMSGSELFAKMAATFAAGNSPNT